MAWIDEMSLLSHLWQVLQKRQTRAHVVMREFRLEANDFNDLRALSEKTKSIIEEQFIFAQSVCELRESRLTDQAFATENRLHVQPMLKP
jgi:predicted DNA-binding ribbon-helix-helix protein